MSCHSEEQRICFQMMCCAAILIHTQMLQLSGNRVCGKLLQTLHGWQNAQDAFCLHALHSPSNDRMQSFAGAHGAVHEEARQRLLEMKQAALKEARQVVIGQTEPSSAAYQLKPGDLVEFRKRVGTYLGGWFAGRIMQASHTLLLCTYSIDILLAYAAAEQSFAKFVVDEHEPAVVQWCDLHDQCEMRCYNMQSAQH